MEIYNFIALLQIVFLTLDTFFFWFGSFQLTLTKLHSIFHLTPKTPLNLEPTHCLVIRGKKNRAIKFTRSWEQINC